MLLFPVGVTAASEMKADGSIRERPVGSGLVDPGGQAEERTNLLNGLVFQKRYQ